MAEKSWIDWLAIVLVIVGALNWGLFTMGYNLVSMIFGTVAWLETTVYSLVGLAGLYMIYYFYNE